MGRIVIALGGNALQENPKDTSAEAQLKTCRNTAKFIVDIVESGNEIIIAHGNGPQVGQIVSTYEAAAQQDKSIPVMPFPECGAMSQGYIGYHLQQAIRDELRVRNIKKEVATIITQVKVSQDDPGFLNPSKPVGSFFSKEEAEMLEKEKNYVMKNDANRGFRRVVPSPMPLEVVEEKVIKTLVEAGHIVITVGGGGIPVIEEHNTLKGVPAVIDKDFASEKIAEILEADMLLILTAVDKVAINYGKEDEKWLDEMTVSQGEEYIKQGHFAPGSMLPKIKAALTFVKSKDSRMAIISSLNKAKAALDGNEGTRII